MNILILGGGGREHALAWAAARNPKCDRLIVAPGNAGIEHLAELADLDISDGEAVVSFAGDRAIDLVIIGPEGPLAAGVADDLRRAGILVFGPNRGAAQLESSKAFTKQVCEASGAPTADFAHFTDLEAAKAYVAGQPTPIVVKADGLAQGKGVIIAQTHEEAVEALERLLSGGGQTVVIEEFLDGEEASFFVLCDGETALPLGSAQDHKRVGEGDTGPNTGGMGAYSPAPVMTGAVTERVMREIVEPCLAEMSKRGMPFQGVLFAGLMIKNGAPKLIEYNTRFGDPECQCLMMRLGAQALDLIQATAEGELHRAKVSWATDHAITVVMAANGYPGDYARGSVIGGLDALPETSNQMVFHAGTAQTSGQITANGGRVLSVTARADSLAEARDQAYEMAAAIDWPDGFYRRDIGWRAL